MQNHRWPRSLLLAAGVFPWIAATHLLCASSATWASDPATSDWNTAANWTPATVPNGPGDNATFDVSREIYASISAPVEVNGIVFQNEPFEYEIVINPGATLTISGAGVTHTVEVLESIITTQNATASGALYFTNATTAGNSIIYTNEMSSDGGPSPLIQFQDAASAGSSGYDNFCLATSGQAGVIEFHDNSTAATGFFRNTGTSGGHSPRISFRDRTSAGQATFSNEAPANGVIVFAGHSTADQATITNEAGVKSEVFFLDNSTAGSASIVNEGGSGPGESSVTYFEDNSTAGNGTFTAAGATVDGATGGRIEFTAGAPTAATATLIATSGVGNGDGAGGGIVFRDSSTGGEARVELDGNGFLDLQMHDASGVIIGSLEGGGVVFLGNSNLSVGSNTSSTLFSGVIQDANGVTASSFTKLGTGTLILTGANTYSGPTFIQGGKLLINNKTGSATGNGAVMVGTGTLGGRGAIAGPVTVGTGTGAGAALVPEKIGGKPAILTLQSTLAFNSDASCVIHVNPKTRFSAQIVAGGVTIDRAQLSLVSPGQTLPPHTVLIVISNTAATPITGTFANLPDGGTITGGSNTFRANYEGGDGNDLTLTVIP